jgi:hypothetical protein
MNMYEWAKKEVEIACEREKTEDEEEGFADYGCACYESALKAFKCLTEDGHSGMSISLTQNILNRLINNKPLTPIEDTDDVWDKARIDRSGHMGEEVNYQCLRMSSLFKYVYADGSVKYRDVTRVRCVDINDPETSWHTGLGDKLIDEMFPITMPYSPSVKSFKVVCEDVLTDRKNGDYDTRAILYCVKPDGEKTDIHRYFKKTNDGWKEISEWEYDKRKEKRV